MVTRRAFLHRVGSGTAALMPLAVRTAALGRGTDVAPSDRLALGAIGLGFGWGMGLGRRGVLFAAVCDVRSDRREEAARIVDERQGAKGCAAYRDFRDLLARGDIDAVYIATPDHWHALTTIAAAKAGKDIYCQKPLTHTVAEGKAVREAVRRYGVVLQHGTQQRSEWSFQRAAELVLNGRIGALRTVRVGVPGGLSLGPQPAMPVPAGFDYDMWLGPAPWAPFTERRCFGPHTWYFIDDYCVGYIAGWGVHHLDSAQQGMGADATGPVAVEGHGVFPKEGLYNTAVSWRVVYTYANGVQIVDTDTNRQRMGVLFEGTGGKVFAWRGGVLETDPPTIRDEPIGSGDVRVRASTDHFQDFIDCVRTRREPAAPVEAAHRSTTLCNIGAIALLLGRELTWDPVEEKFAGDEEANRLLSKPMRDPWRL